ncbi:CRISPR-associated endonuclease Cas3'' [Candidatus Protofrankia californiensis]|uniref:CRISPR-associated endonuclease Cas3'' n=1 Tax=Candidatus Protofrankia californiensis TaxID=1839754 RepID=UPI0019D263AB|nr:CRISPR-associated endonuclease Cas3'' [Candidatus Protofrankia californiensis]
MTNPLHTVLATVLAKSGRGGHGNHPESLTDHSAATLRAAREIERRIGRLHGLPPDIEPSLWGTVAAAALTHDAGKVATGFQQMLQGRSRTWGQRHEVVSLGFLPLLFGARPDLAWVALGVATHHRALRGGPDSRESLRRLYREHRASPNGLAKKIGAVDGDLASALLQWLAAHAREHGVATTDVPEIGVTPPPVSFDGIPFDGDALVTGAHRLLFELFDQWDEPVDPDRGLAAVLVQGAVTMADHLSSAHGCLHTRQPFDSGYPERLAVRLAGSSRVLHPHQKEAALVDGHLILRAWTGSGKTEAGLLWASRQVTAIGTARGGVPRVFYTLPYLASINAMTARLAEHDIGDETLIGVSHSRAASYYLSRSLCGADDDAEDDNADGHTGAGTAAAKALARAGATRLFRETVRVGTPYQLLRGALAGPTHSSILLDSANSVFVLDELHAYDARRLGFILAAFGLWTRLGSRIGVLSATLPTPLVKLVRTSLENAGNTASPVASVALVEASHGDAPSRHRIRTVQAHLTDPAVQNMIFSRLAAGESVLVVANNVADAQGLFEALSPYAPPLHAPPSDDCPDGDQNACPDDDPDVKADGEPAGMRAACLLHSRFRRRDRATIEGTIINRYRSGTSAETRQPGLVVATQVVEVSLDIDFDVIFTSCAPLDALIQRFGRVNRSGARPPADVVVCQAEMRARRGGSNSGSGTTELYADGVYEQEPAEAAWQVLTAHDGESVSEASLVGWLDGIFDSEWGRRWVSEVTHHQDAFTRSFLTFTRPFDDRSHLTDAFDEMFDGTEAILASDVDEYAGLLAATTTGAQGRLLAADLLIPLPYYAGKLARWDRQLGVFVIDGDYDARRGLTAVRGRPADRYQPGELI